MSARRTTRSKNAREVFIEQVSHGRGLAGSVNKRRKSFTHLNHDDDMDFAYRSTPDYLRQRGIRTSPSPTEMTFARNIPRTKSASELSPTNNFHRSVSGNPKYKAQEDYFDEIQTLKKDMKAIKDENSSLRAKIRRSEEDNIRKRKEIDSLYDTNKDGDLRRTLSGASTDRKNNITPASANVVMSLKQRLFRVETQLKNKETAIEELKSDPRWTQNSELEIQNHALRGELKRQEVERLNYIQQNDYVGTIDEEKKAAIRKLDGEKKELKKENDSLKKRIYELENGNEKKPLSLRSPIDGNDTEAAKTIETLKQECESQQNELKRLTDRMKAAHRERDQVQEQLDQTNEKLEKVQRDRDRYHNELEQANERLKATPRKSEPKITLHSRSIFDDDDLDQNPVRVLSTTSLHKEVKASDSRVNSPTRKANEHSAQPSGSTVSLSRKQSNPSLKTSTKDVRADSPAKKDDRVENFREKHSAVVIQRGWRQHGGKRKDAARDLEKTRIANLDKKPSREQSPRASMTKIDNLGSGITKDRRPSTNVNDESALKTVQASLRGHLNRNTMDDNGEKPPSSPPRPGTPTPPEKHKPLTSDDDDDLIVTPKTPLKSSDRPENKRDTVDEQPKTPSRTSLRNDKTGFNDRPNTSKQDLTSKTNRLPSPPPTSSRPSSAKVDKDNGSKNPLPTERHKLGSTSRVPTTEPEATPKSPRASSSQLIKPRSSLSNIDKTHGSDKALSKDPNKLSSTLTPIPAERDAASKPNSSSDVRRSSRQIPPEDSRPSSKKNLNDSKTSAKDDTQNAHDTDEDDIVML